MPSPRARRLRSRARWLWLEHRIRLALAVVALGLVGTLIAGRGPGPMRFTPAPIATPGPVQATPGCRPPGSGEARRPVARLTAAAPDPRPRFFAEVPGELPPTGTPVVGGVQLPAGSRCDPFWSTDAGVEDGLVLAGRLAAVFPSTGLWPVLWAWPGEEPDAYFPDELVPDPPGAPDAATVLLRSWTADGADAGEGPFPGLAAAAPGANSGPFDPFGPALAESLVTTPPAGGWSLMLVPVNRPADVPRVLGTAMTEHFSNAEMSAVLRSWEDRFGAVLTVLAPSTFDLSVAAPPSGRDQTNRVAAEHVAFAPEGDHGSPSAKIWSLGWPD